jgi:hypothetical protein
MRSLRTLLFGALVVALAACGGGTASSSAAESTGGEPSTAASASVPAAETPAASTDDGGPAPSSIEELEDELVPPNSTQLSRQEVAQGVVVAYTSTDSVGDLRSYYVQKIAELNLQVISTQEAANTVTVAFGTDASGGLGGTVSLQNAGDITNVILTLADASL